MQFAVRAVPREGHDGRNRDGRRFSSAHDTLLAADELTPGILADPLLIVTPVLPPTVPRTPLTISWGCGTDGHAHATEAEAALCHQVGELLAELELLRSAAPVDGAAGFGDLARLGELSAMADTGGPVGEADLNPSEDSTAVAVGDAPGDTPAEDPESPRCGAPRKDGEPCRAVVGETGERCALHRD